MKAIIGIDPGHGGSSSGTYSVDTAKDGLWEKDYALELALLIEERLLHNGFGVVLSRRTDRNPGSVSERAEYLCGEGTDFNISIHFNGFGNERANGTEIYVPHAERLAGIEAGFHEILQKYFSLRSPFARSNSYFDRNRIFDKKLDCAARRFGAVSAELDYFGFVRASWAAGVSADLLEVCFLTNPQDFAIYKTFREEIADGLAQSIVHAFGEKYSGYGIGETPKAKPRIPAPVRGNKKRDVAL